MTIRKAVGSDRSAIWAMLEPTIRAGDTFALPRDMAEADAFSYWMSADRHVFVLEERGEVLGSYYIRPNQSGGGDHVANAGYVTAPAARGQGIAGRMCADSIEQARGLGFAAMQFNFVVSTNVAAVHLWQRHGFAVVGRLPGAFRHPTHGPVDALVMFRTL